MKKNIFIKVFTILTVLSVSVTMFAFTNVSASTTNKLIMSGIDNNAGTSEDYTYTSNNKIRIYYSLFDDTRSSITLSFNNSDIKTLYSPDDYGIRRFRLTFTSDVIVDFKGQNYITKEVNIVSRSSDFDSIVSINGEEINGYDSDTLLIDMNTSNIPDNQRPAIDGQEFFVTNVDDAKDVAFFQSFLSAYDETDGDVTSRIKVKTDNYTANKKVLGIHTITFVVDDLSGNEATLTVNVQVVDVTVPIITGSNTVVSIGYKETYDFEAFRKTLTVKDNYDTLTNASIKIKSNDYIANKTKLGTYSIIFEASDTSGNVGTFEKRIKVVDNVIPTFSGPTVITTSNKTILTESDVREQLTAHDEIDKNITSKIKLVSDDFTGKGDKVGSYDIKYSVEDNSGNVAYHTVTVKRLDEIPPVIWIEDNVTIRTTPDVPLTFEQIITILEATGQVTISATTKFSVLMDEYSGNEQVVGKYLYSVQARSANGNESIHNMNIIVLSDDSDNPSVDVDPGFDFGVWVKDNSKNIAIVSVASLALIGGIIWWKKRK